MRHFEPVKNAEKYYIPIRKTKHSAGYDFICPETFTIYPNEIKLIKTNVKCIMPLDEYLQLSIRSSLGLKGLIMPNAPGIVDSDYYNNPDNDGNIGLIVMNLSDNIIQIQEGDRIMQGVFLKYHTCGDIVNYKRTGGYGSTGGQL